MNDDRNRSQIIRVDARNCFVESLNDAFEIGKAHFTFASYDLSKPSGQRQTNSIQIYMHNRVPTDFCSSRQDLCARLSAGYGGMKSVGNRSIVLSCL